MAAPEDPDHGRRPDRNTTSVRHRTGMTRHGALEDPSPKTSLPMSAFGELGPWSFGRPPDKNRTSRRKRCSRELEEGPLQSVYPSGKKERATPPTTCRVSYRQQRRSTSAVDPLKGSLLPSLSLISVTVTNFPRPGPGNSQRLRHYIFTQAYR